MRHLFDDWEHVRARLKSARKVALFLDFDGTLVKFRPRPEQVWLDSAVRRTLAALAGSSRFRVTIISGRKQEDVASRIGLPSVKCLGLHGSEGRAGAAALPESRHALKAVRGLLEDIVTQYPGVWIEDKRDILTIHYRGAQATVYTKAEQIVRFIAGRFAKWVRIAGGKKVWELIPHELEGKGVAVRHELKSMGWLAVPIYVGDDAADEPVFEALYRGVTVRVGPVRKSHARYRLDSVHQVRTFLERLRSECV